MGLRSFPRRTIAPRRDTLSSALGMKFPFFLITGFAHNGKWPGLAITHLSQAKRDPISPRVLPFVSRVERMRHARRFSRLRDATDVPHAIAASVYECEAVVAYDEHFSAISDLIPHTTPEDYL